MKSFSKIHLLTIAALGFILSSFPAAAEDLAATTMDESNGDNPFAAAPLADEDLDKSRGLNLIAENDVVNASETTGVSVGNSATNNVSGSNNIDDSALNNNAGIVTVFQNSGNNNILQQSTIFNVNLSN